MEEMRKQNAILGGEEYGHTVFLEHQTTGDGLLTALILLEIMSIKNKPLSELKNVMTVFPQVLVNVDVKSKPPLDSLPNVNAAIQKVEEELKGKGRVFVRLLWHSAPVSGDGGGAIYRKSGELLHPTRVRS